MQVEAKARITDRIMQTTQQLKLYVNAYYHVHHDQ